MKHLHHTYTMPQNQRFQLMRWATYASVTVATCLISIKFYAWWITDAISLQATLIDSVLDALASVVNLFAVRHAQQPADAEHRFGHGKTEAIAALGQSLLIAASGFWLIYEAVDRFSRPIELGETTTAIVVMVISIFATLCLIAFQVYVVRQTGSAAIRADSVHYQSDFIINMGVIASLVISTMIGIHWFDPLVGILIALYILYTAWDIVKEAFDILMDRELSDDVRDIITDIVLQTDPQIMGLHELRTRSSGIHLFIQLHLELDGSMTLSDAHALSERVMQNLLIRYPHAEIIIHEDPVTHDS